ncbi:hypothetical protein EVAR_17401_1 [Eumeta japonica]|uniref:Uncharacterized protein n=1 Tax=Eumeta variegata TaxID=151549 RepID=A0A4C1VAF3_EUMVA|nr:hypothetical protein EVAR_17401_1 [Eumeta japonica]
MQVHAAFSLHYPSTTPSLKSTIENSMRVGVRREAKLCTSLYTQCSERFFVGYYLDILMVFRRGRRELGRFARRLKNADKLIGHKPDAVCGKTYPSSFTSQKWSSKFKRDRRPARASRSSQEFVEKMKKIVLENG